MKDKKTKKGELEQFMAEACVYAQDHLDIGVGDHDIEAYLSCTDHQIACFLAQNTVHGHKGVEDGIILAKLIERKKTVIQWKKIIGKLVKELGGWK